jgi:hypothetical protein
MADPGGSKASREQRDKIGGISGGDKVGSGRRGEDVGGERGKGG